jgi:hypothetical protein
MTHTEHPPVATADDADSADGAKVPQRHKQADRLIALCRAAELFHDGRNGTSYASMQVQKHVETYPVRSREFRGWLGRGYYGQFGSAPSQKAIDEALNVLEGKAMHEGPEYPVYVRIAGGPERVIIDLANPDWQVVQITGDGWTVLDRCPVKFRRSSTTLPLPLPQSGGHLRLLQRFLNVRDREFALVGGFLLGALMPSGPYPILEVTGEQGSAKSTLSTLLRAVIDPNRAARKSPPKDERDLAIAASNSWLAVFDNVSRITDSMSDALCRLSTGGAFASRKLYTDDEEVVFDYMRPLIVNGIEDLALRPDLLERTIVLELPRLPSSARRAEEELWADFGNLQPLILGALYDAVACAIRELPNLSRREWPRLADFARWVTAAEPALGWSAGTFLAALSSNRRSAFTRALSAEEPLSSMIRGLAADPGGWLGTASELLRVLENRNYRPLPTTPSALAGKLRRLAPALRAVGIEVRMFRQGHEGTRFIELRRCADETVSVVGIDSEEAA